MSRSSGPASRAEGSRSSSPGTRSRRSTACGMVLFDAGHSRTSTPGRRTGKLLFDRIRDLGREVPVLFVGERSQDRGSRLEERARQAGAAGLIHCPLSPGEVESAVRSLISRAGEERLASPRPPPEAPARRAPALRRSSARRRRLRICPWLRLFHAMSRLRRSARDPEAAARELAGLVLEMLRPEAVGIFYPAPPGEGGQWVRLAAASLSERGFESIAAGAGALDERRVVIEIGPATRMVIQGLAEDLRESGHAYAGDLEELLRDLFRSLNLSRCTLPPPPPVFSSSFLPPTKIPPHGIPLSWEKHWFQSRVATTGRGSGSGRVHSGPSAYGNASPSDMNAIPPPALPHRSPIIYFSGFFPCLDSTRSPRMPYSMKRGRETGLSCVILPVARRLRRRKYIRLHGEADR